MYENLSDFRIMISLCLFYFSFVTVILILVCASEALVTSADLARRFGVAESSLTGSKHSWKVECSETSNDFFERFRDIDEVNDFLRNDLKASLRGTLSVIGTTAEGREILALEAGSTSKSSPIILAMAGLHGREWTSIAALLYAMHNLKPEELSEVSVVFIPVINPDGYARTFDGMTHTKERYKHGVGVETDEDQPNRYWRKNGVGVDLNRNFGAHWHNDTTKSSKMKNSDVYHGSGPFSERETKALRDWAKTNIDRLNAIIDFHCCIGAILAPPIPPSTSKESQMDNERIGMRLVSALSAGGRGVTKTVKGGDGLPGAYEWRPRNPKDPGAGLSSSWGFLDLFVDLTYVVEMRGKFVAPCFEIKQLGKEAFFAMRALVEEVAKRPVRSLAERKRIRLAGNDNLRGASSASMSSFSTRLSSGHTMVILVACVIVLAYLVRIKGMNSAGGFKKGSSTLKE